jgi:7-cyano-7-deazaguanine synthase
MTAEAWRAEPVAVLVSGGPDSVILLAELARTSPRVVPVFVRFGLIWEADEEQALRRFIRLIESPVVDALRVFDLPVTPVYGAHWSTTGQATPDAATPDAAVFLPGRNLLVLVQAAVWCHLQGIRTLALGVLANNPFPDSTEAFFTAYEAALNLALVGQLRLVRPFQTLTKTEVLQRGRDLPLEATWSCIAPEQGQHCGRCNKCAERQRAFGRAGLADPTRYVQLRGS